MTETTTAPTRTLTLRCRCGWRWSVDATEALDVDAVSCPRCYQAGAVAVSESTTG